MIVFRADGSNSTGAGHLMRCMTIADAFPNKDRILFITNSIESVGMVNARGYEAIAVSPENIDNIEDEIDEVKNILTGNNTTFLMVDSYRVTDVYLKELRKVTTLGLIEDKGDRKYPVDLILNYNIFADKKKLNEMYGDEAMVLCGAEYVPIREEFCRAKYTIYKSVKNVLILTGGGDAFNLAEKFVDYFGNRKDDIKYHLVCGYYAKDNQSFLAKVSKTGNFTVHYDVSDIWNLMTTCDIAVSAGGTTIYELMTIGVPTIGYIFADNQKPLMDYVHEKEIFPFCGDFREKKDSLFSSIADKIESLNRQDERKRISDFEKSVIAGSGSLYIKEAIGYCISKKS